jgi:hypothetical protein
MLLHTDSSHIPTLAPNKAQASRNGVPRHEKLLLLGILVVVAAWIIFRVAIEVLAAFS